MKRNKNAWRKLRAAWRDTALLMREFGWPLFIYLGTIIAAGLSYFWLSQHYGEPMDSISQSIYLAMTLTLFSPIVPFPQHPILQSFYFLVPLIALGALAQGVTDFGILLFNRRARSREWEMAIASTFSNHTILIGLGHLGYRVIQNLHAMEESVVVIELNPSADLSQTVQGMGIPVIHDDASREATLNAAGITRARTIVLCTQNDALNLQIAVKARSLNPAIQVVVRIFDDDFAASLQQQFGFFALSATSMAAPAFAAAAAGADITRPIMIENEALSLARLTIDTKSRLANMTVGKLEDTYNVNVILLKRKDQPDIQPDNTRLLQTGDHLAVLGNPKDISLLVHDNH